jgi:hypothetical protein
VGINGLVVENPAGFPEGAMLRVPEVYANCVPVSLLTKTIQVRELRVNVAELAIVKNKDGSFNVGVLMPPPSPGGEKKPAPPSGGEKKPAPAASGRTVKIHTLDVTIGTLRFMDCTQDPPTEKTVNIDLHERCDNVTTTAGAYIVTKAAVKGIAAGMTQLGPLLAQGALGGIATEAGKVLDGLGAAEVKDAADAIQGLFKKK